VGGENFRRSSFQIASSLSLKEIITKFSITPIPDLLSLNCVCFCACLLLWFPDCGLLFLAAKCFAVKLSRCRLIYPTEPKERDAVDALPILPSICETCRSAKIPPRSPEVRVNDDKRSPSVARH